jgi:hypothetical protein
MSEELSNSAQEAVRELFPEEGSVSVPETVDSQMEDRPEEALTNRERHDNQAVQVLSDVENILEGNSELSEDGIIQEVEQEVSTEENHSSQESSEETVENAVDEDPVKTIPVTFGDESYDLPEDAMMEVVIDGEPQQISISDFRNSVSGQKAIQKRFSAVDRDKKEVQKRIDLWNQGEQQVKQLLDEGRAKDALSYLASHSGIIDPGVLMQQVAKEITPMVREYMEMTPEQRAQQESLQKESSYKKQLESAQKNLQQMQNRQEQMSRVQSVQKAYKLSDAEYVEAYDSLMNDLETGKIQYNKSVTPEDVGDYMLYNRYAGWTRDALSSIDPKFAQDNRVVNDFVIEAKRLYDKGYDISPQAMAQIASHVYGTPNTQVPTKKSRTLPKAKAKGPIRAPKQKGHWMNDLVNDLDSIQSKDDRKRINKKWGNI